MITSEQTAAPKSFAIVLVCYKRLDGVRRLVTALEKADYAGRKDISLIFSIDNSGSSAVKEFAEGHSWPYGPKRVRTFPERQGLKNHILQCGDFTREYDIVAILEDDILVSDSFYRYAYGAAEAYWNDKRVAGISLYNFQKNWLRWILRFEPQHSAYDAYFMRIAQSWGQVWMLKKWQDFKAWYDEHLEFTKSDSIPAYLNSWPESSWLKYHDRYCIETDRWFVYPYVSLSTNCSSAGEHTSGCTADYQVELQYGKEEYSFPPLNEEAIRYDEYMDRVGLGRFLGVPEEELTVDLWETKHPSIWKKYLLTCRRMGCKALKEFGLSLRPIELSVIENIPGHDLFLYDTTQPMHRACKDEATGKLLAYSLRTHDASALMKCAAYAGAMKYKHIAKRIVGKTACRMRPRARRVFIESGP